MSGIVIQLIDLNIGIKLVKELKFSIKFSTGIQLGK